MINVEDDIDNKLIVNDDIDVGGGGGGAGDDDFSVTAFVCVVEALADVVDSEDELA